MTPNIGDTIYYINTGTKKGHSDVKRITHFFYYADNGEKTEITKEVEKKYKELHKNASSTKTRLEIAKDLYGASAFDEDEIILNCKLVPHEIVESERAILCSEVDDIEYNVEKYIDQFNKRVAPLLVCFHPDIRNNILITNPKDRKFFTEEEAKLVCGYPNKPTDQDTYEALMTPEKKEIAFWTRVGETPPFVKECGIDWDKLVADYKAEIEEEDNTLFQEENAKYLEALDKLTKEDIEAFEEEGKLPSSISKLVTMDSDMRFYFKKLPSKTPSTGGYVFEDISYETLVPSEESND